MYLRGLTAIFSVYPKTLGMAIIDPVKGLPSKTQYLPSIAEVKAALEAISPPPPMTSDADRLQSLAIKQLEERLEGEKWQVENPIDRRKEFIRKHWTEGARKEMMAPPPKLEGWQERGKAYLQQNTPAEKLMNMGLFDPKNRGARWE